MAKKRSQPRTRTSHGGGDKHVTSLNGSDLAETHHSDIECAAGHEAHDLDAHECGEPTHAGGYLSRWVYTASYHISYGVVFPVMFIAYSIPTENALVRGLIEGGRAARDAVGGLQPLDSEASHAAEAASA